ncbi:AAA family ATPase [Rhizobium sp.]|uniref:AAA family ATPase n=1 Tax=Rhizobium sp. TaxID=391 RepID=UPI0028A75227
MLQCTNIGRIATREYYNSPQATLNFFNLKIVKPKVCVARDTYQVGNQLHIVNLEDAAGVLHTCERVLVIGCSGGGKSTLSRRLSDHLQMPYISMDRDFYWLPGWVKRDRETTRALISEAVSRDRWIMDGTGSSSFELRMPRANMVVWVRMPRWLCLWGVFSRSLRHLGQTRPDMAPGCPERLADREFLSFIWNFERQTSPRIVDGVRRFSPDCPVLILTSRRQMRQLLSLVGA